MRRVSADAQATFQEAKAICDRDGRMVAEGKEDLPAHVGTLPHTVKAVISWIGKDRIDEGDIFIMNDAFLGDEFKDASVG